MRAASIGGRRPGGGVGAAVEQGADHLLLALEHRTGQRGLALAVGPVGFGAALEQGPYGVGVAVVGGEHDEGVAAVVGEVGGHPGVDVGGDAVGVALPGEVEDLGGELEDLRVVRGLGTGGGIGRGLGHAAHPTQGSDR